MQTQTPLTVAVSHQAPLVRSGMATALARSGEMTVLEWDGSGPPPWQQHHVDVIVADYTAGVQYARNARLPGPGRLRPSATVLGIDVPPVIGSSSAIQASAAARVSLRCLRKELAPSLYFFLKEPAAMSLAT